MRIEAALASGPEDARQYLLRDGASRGPIATTADFPSNHSAPQRLFRTPGSCVDGGIKQKREQRIPFAIKVPHEPGDVDDGRPLLEHGAEPIGQATARHGHAMRGDTARGVAIPNRQCVLKNVLHLTRQARG